MHINEKSNWIKHYDFTAISIISVIIAFICAYYIKFGDFGWIHSTEWKSILLIFCLTNMVVMIMMNPFSRILRRPYYEDAVKLLFFTVYSFVIISVFLYVMKAGVKYSRITVVLTFLIYYVICFMLTYIRKKLLLSGKVKGFTNRKRQLFVIARYADIEETIRNIYAGDIEEYEIAGYCFTDGIFEGAEYNEAEVVDIEWVAEQVVTEHIDDVFIAEDPSVLSAISYKRLIDNGITVNIDIESMIGTEGDDQFISKIGVYKTASIGSYAFDTKQMLYFAIKKVFDVVLGIIGCIVLIPLMAVVKISNSLSGDNASVIYHQTRVGQYGKTFKLYKFRSMVPNADDVLNELLQKEEYRKQWEANQKFDDDPRITKTGKILRRLSLDEFPQFINLLKGDMSLIGPRPLMEGELNAHDGLMLYNKVKPGITGWWACNGRSNINYRERLELEYYYVKNCSLYLDLLIIIRTIVSVLKRDGAQ